jgi:hypothetical protein
METYGINGVLNIAVENMFFCSTLSEFENFLMCERILINVTTCQNESQANFKNFKRFGAFKGFAEQKNFINIFRNVYFKFSL